MSFLFGSSKSESSIPEWLKEPTMEMLQRSIDMGKTGYMPYAGPQVAALDPAQVAAMENTNSSAQAFGMNSAMPRIPDATDYGGGTWGYSSLPLYDQQQQWMEDNRPGQKSFYDSFFIDPQTGLPGANAQTQAEAPQEPYNPYAGPPGGGIYAGGGGNVGDSAAGGGGTGGYSGVGDMFNGGGPGQSGSTYGGALGGVSNAAGFSPDEGVGGFFGGLW